MYMSILSKLLFIHIHPLSHVPSCIYICGLVMFWICMYTLVYTWHTYALKKSSFDDFHVLRNIELDCLFSWLCVSHELVHSLLLNVSHDCVFMSMIWALWTLSVLVIMWFTCFSWNIILFGLGKGLTPMDPKECGYQRPPLLYLM